MVEAMLYEKIGDNKVQCFLCSHLCRISDGACGFCRVRENRGGTLFTRSYGALIAEQVDPIEKKPLYHFFPGSTSFSVATNGCNFTCGFCQNWQISQSNRSGALKNNTSADYIVNKALSQRCKSIACTYTEPTIYFEYAYDICKKAKFNNLSTVFVTNGYMTEQALLKIEPFLDACNVDLKSFNNEFYRKNCSANLDSVLKTLKKIKETNIWLEITTLIIPGENDSELELKNIAQFIADLDPDIPWHISRFFPQYQFQEKEITNLEIIKKAEKIGKDAGLHFVYPGNTGGQSDTLCCNCGSTLIKRSGYNVQKIVLEDGKCFHCGTIIKGVW